MSVKKYFKLGTSVLDAVIKADKRLEANRDPVSGFIQRTAEQHEAMIEKNGSSEALDSIYVDEIVKYYNAIMGLPEDFIRGVLLPLAEMLVDEDEPLPKERIVFYPCFAHEKQGVAIGHRPVTRAFILDGHNAIPIIVDYKGCDKGLEITSDTVICITGLVAESVADRWSGSHTLTEEEKGLIVCEIFDTLILGDEMTTKDGILGYLADEVDPKLKRLL